MQTYRHPHRWKLLLKYTSTSSALVHAIWEYTLTVLTNCREQKDFQNVLLNKCSEIAMQQFKADENLRTIRPSVRRHLIKSLIEVE